MNVCMYVCVSFIFFPHFLCSILFLNNAFKYLQEFTKLTKFSYRKSNKTNNTTILNKQSSKTFEYCVEQHTHTRTDTHTRSQKHLHWHSRQKLTYKTNKSCNWN